MEQTRLGVGRDVVGVRPPVAGLALEPEQPSVGEVLGEIVVLRVAGDSRAVLAVCPDHRDFPILAPHDLVGDLLAICRQRETAKAPGALPHDCGGAVRERHHVERGVPDDRTDKRQRGAVVRNDRPSSVEELNLRRAHFPHHDVDPVGRGRRRRVDDVGRRSTDEVLGAWAIGDCAGSGGAEGVNVYRAARRRCPHEVERPVTAVSKGQPGDTSARHIPLLATCQVPHDGMRRLGLEPGNLSPELSRRATEAATASTRRSHAVELCPCCLERGRFGNGEVGGFVTRGREDQPQSGERGDFTRGGTGHIYQVEAPRGARALEVRRGTAVTAPAEGIAVAGHFLRQVELARHERDGVPEVQGVGRGENPLGTLERVGIVPSDPRVVGDFPLRQRRGRRRRSAGSGLLGRGRRDDQERHCERQDASFQHEQTRSLGWCGNVVAGRRVGKGEK